MRSGQTTIHTSVCNSALMTCHAEKKATQRRSEVTSLLFCYSTLPLNGDVPLYKVCQEMGTNHRRYTCLWEHLSKPCVCFSVWGARPVFLSHNSKRGFMALRDERSEHFIRLKETFCQSCCGLTKEVWVHFTHPEMIRDWEKDHDSANSV